MGKIALLSLLICQFVIVSLRWQKLRVYGDLKPIILSGVKLLLRALFMYFIVSSALLFFHGVCRLFFFASDISWIRCIDAPKIGAMRA